MQNQLRWLYLANHSRRLEADRGKIESCSYTKPLALFVATFILQEGAPPLTPHFSASGLNRLLSKKMDNRKEYYKKYNQEKRKNLKDVHIYLTDDEYNYFEKVAEKEGLKVATIIKMMALIQAEKTYYLPKEIQENLNEFVFLIRNIANNINQIARHSNTIKALTDEHGLLSWLKQLEEAVKEYVKKETK